MNIACMSDSEQRILRFLFTLSTSQELHHFSDSAVLSLHIAGYICRDWSRMYGRYYRITALGRERLRKTSW